MYSRSPFWQALPLLLLANAALLVSGCPEDPEPPDPVCGDGLIAGDEQCDDGNTNDGDGCSALCTIESPPPPPGCGDGVLGAMEECDDGAGNSDTQPNACRTSCVNPLCGDSVVDDLSGEVCDDGNVTPGDGCDATCQAETLTGGDCTTPNVITEGTHLGDTATSADSEDLTCATGSGSPDMVFELTMPAAGDLLVELTDMNPFWDAAVEIRTGACDAGAATVVDCAAGLSPGNTELAQVLEAPAGQTFWIVVDSGNGTDAGPFSLNVYVRSVILLNDPCDPTDPTMRCEAGATCFDDGTGSGAACTAAITNQCAMPLPVGPGSYLGDPSGLPDAFNSSCGGIGPEVVFEYTVGPNDEDLYIDLIPIGGGSRAVSLTTMACGGFEYDCDTGFGSASIVVTDLPPGTYYIMADSYGGSVGPFQLDIFAVEVLPALSPCTPGDPTTRCEPSTTCWSATGICEPLGVVLTETFDTAVPATWTVIDNLSDGWTWQWCPDGGPCPPWDVDNQSLNNNTGSASGGGFVGLDDDDAGPGTDLLEVLISPSVDLTGTIAAELAFDTQWVNFGNDRGFVDISIDGGMTWLPLDTLVDTISSARLSYDISAIAAGQPDVTIRFTYDDMGAWAWRWHIDDFTISAL